MAVLVQRLLQHSTEISTMSPSCARCAPTDSNDSLVHYYGRPKAWGAPACLHAAACEDHNTVTLSPQLGDPQRRGPAASRIGCFYGHGAMPKPL